MLVMEKDELLTPQEIAERYRVSADTIRWNIRNGRLKAIKFGRQYRIRLVDLEKFLSEQDITDKK